MSNTTGIEEFVQTNHEITLHAEAQVIGSILHKPEMLISCDLDEQDFQNPGMKHAYKAIQAVNVSSEPVDIITVANWLETETNGKNFLPVLAKAMESCVAPANGESYSRQVRQRSNARKAREIANNLAARANDGAEAIDQAIRELMTLTAERRQHECGISDALRDAAERIETLNQNGGRIPGISTGLTDLDHILGGFQPSDLYVIGARTSMGKTALLLNLALAADRPVGIISAEQPRVQIGNRCIAINGGIHAARLRNAQLHDDEWPRLTETIGRLGNRKIRIYDRPTPTIDVVVRQARAWKHHYGIKALYVDYLQRIGASDRKAPRFERVSQVVMGLKELARDLDIPVIVLAQVNRRVEERPDKRPCMSDLKDSGDIEQEADNIMTIYRDEVYNDDTPDKGIAELDVLKNRHGPIGMLRVAWRAHFMQFLNLAAYGG